MSIAAAIIAGGQARRYGGKVKAHLRVDGERIIDRQLAVLRPLVEAIAISANEPEPFAELGLPVVPDAQRGQGPLAGLAAALQWCPAERLFVVASDMPFLEESVIAQLIDTPGELVLPVLNGQPQPLHAVYATSCLPAVRARLQRGARALYRVADDVSVVRVEFAPSCRSFLNVNSPEDLVESTTPSGVS